MAADGSLAGAACLALAAVLAVPGCSPGPSPPEITIYAAASLRDALEDLGPGIEAAAGIEIVLNFAASDVLARQIIAARRADLFLSADEAQVDLLEREGLIEPGSRAVLVSNRLVVIAPAGSDLTASSASDLAAPAIARLAIGDPRGVPAGRYAREWLSRAGVWEDLKDRIVPGVDVRAALAAVESGGVQAGVVYSTDAAISPRVKVLFEVPEEEGPRIIYSGALLAGRPRTARARAVLEFLRSEEGQAVFAKHGFLPAGR